MVSTPLVQNRSLTAIGMPSSGRASPRAEPLVGGRGHVERPLRRLGDVGVERPRRLHRGDMGLRQLARRKLSCARSPSRASARVSSVSRSSLDHLRHGEEAAAPDCGALPRIASRQSPSVTTSSRIGRRIAATLVIGGDAVGVDLAELLDPGQDLRQLGGERFELVLGRAGCAPARRYAPRRPCPTP